MNTTLIGEFQKLRLNEKIELIQTLWDVAKEQEKLRIPDDHIKILEERMKLIGNGEAKYRSWDSIRAKYPAT